MAVWLDGALVADEDARVSVYDHGLTVGDGVFETVRAADGVPFALTRHLARLTGSARAVGLPDPDLDLVRRGCSAVLAAAAGRGVHRLRITYTGGPGPLGSARGSAPPTLVIATAPSPPWPMTAAVVLVPWPRNERGPLVGVKSTSYAENVVALAHARRLGAAEAVFADTRGRLCEGTGSNVFVVLGDRLRTPALSSGCLPGITRGLVLEWTDAVEEDLPVQALHEADEVFLTSSTREVQGVHAVDGTALSAPGPVTGHVAARFAMLAGQDPDP